LNAVRSMAPSTTQGAVSPSHRSPAIKLVPRGVV
jgi:hypothetical protein